MFDLLFSRRGVAFGAGYSDVNAQLPILKVLVVLTGLVAVLCLVTIRLRSWRPLLGGVARSWAWRFWVGSCTRV